MSTEAARRLAELGSRHVLIIAALDGRIDKVECAMDRCLCPDGRSYFTDAQRPWGISADRWPITGKDGGEYTPDNVRVAHWLCNSAEGFDRGRLTTFSSPEIMARASALHRAYRHTPETRARMSASLKGRKATSGSFKPGHPRYGGRRRAEGGRSQSV